MLGANNYTTALLALIVIILLLGVGIALYYVLDLNWFDSTTVQVYDELNENKEQSKPEIKVEKQIKYDTAKRTYNILLNTEELKIVVYKDGTVGITMLENDKYKQISAYEQLVNKEIKLNLTNIIRVYEVEISSGAKANKKIVVLDSNGALYNLSEEELTSNGQYIFKKIEGIANIIDVRQITNENLVENINGVNAIAIDNESNELLITDYLLNIK